MKRKLNRCISFRKKNEVYVFYVNFNFIFLKGVAAGFLDTILASVSPEGWLDLSDVPESFTRFLIARKIIIEEVVS